MCWRQLTTCLHCSRTCVGRCQKQRSQGDVGANQGGGHGGSVGSSIYSAIVGANVLTASARLDARGFLRGSGAQPNYSRGGSYRSFATYHSLDNARIAWRAPVVPGERSGSHQRFMVSKIDMASCLHPPDLVRRRASIRSWPGHGQVMADQRRPNHEGLR